MVKIVIENIDKKEVVANDLSKSVLAILHSHLIDWMHACGGKGRCTTCKMIVTSGMDNVTPASMAEVKFRQQGLLVANERLACQSKLHGSIRIRIPAEGKLPHVTYSD